VLGEVTESCDFSVRFYSGGERSKRKVPITWMGGSVSGGGKFGTKSKEGLSSFSTFYWGEGGFVGKN